MPTSEHGNAPGGTVRGNLTTVTKWAAPTTSCNPKSGTAVISHTKWYDTGEAYQQIDPLGHTTTHSYDSAYAGALVTNTCSPATSGVAHCVSATYDFPTGLMTSFTNENATTQASGNSQGDSAHTSTYGYDPSWRLTSAYAPPDLLNNGASAHTIFSYGTAYPFSIQRQKSITNGVMDISTSYFDGVGRVNHAEHATPNGPSIVMTTFDGLGQATSVTNPYYSTSDSTYGITYSQHDGLGRATQVTEQDGSVSSVQYNAVTSIAMNSDCTITKDEAGKQRGACTDALNRLVEVDEPNPGTTPIVSNYATLQSNGSFVLYNPTNTALWSTGTSGSGYGPLEVQDDGNLVLYQFKWQTGTYRVWNGAVIPYDSCRTGESLFAGQVLSEGQCLENVSNTTFALMTNGDLQMYDRQLSQITWHSNTSGNAGAHLSMQSDGNLVIYSSSGVALWSSGTSGSGANVATLENDGRIILYSTVWNSGTSQGQVAGSLTHPSCDLGSGLGTTGTVGAGQCIVSPNGHFELLLQTDGNMVLYNLGVTPNTALWSTSTAISPADPGVALRTLYTYDGLGNLTCVEQHGGVAGTGCSSSPGNDTTSPWRVRRFTYDSLSRLLTAKNPESGIINYLYDNDGNLLQKTSPAPNQNGSATQVISYCYDELHRIKGKGYGAQSCPLSSPVVSYAYDSGTNAIGHLTSMTDQAGTATYAYDILGRMSSETRVIAGISKSLSYSYNLDGSLKTLTYPSGAVVTYTPDSAGRILSAVDSSGVNYVTGATYDATSALTGYVSGSGGTTPITNAFTYNKRLQPVTMSASTASQTVFSIGYDFHFGNGDNGNVWNLYNYKDRNRDQTFTYDVLNRLTSAQNAGTNCAAMTVNNKTEYWGNSYSYDAWGNVLGKTITKCGAENLSVTADAHNWIHGSGADYQYDVAGNMTYDATGNVNLSYDLENRVTGAAGYGYIYDGDGNRVEKATPPINPTSGTLYWYMTPGIVAESDLSGILKSEYVFFDGERVARKDFTGGTTSVEYYFSDHLKTASVITDSVGNIKAESDYYPWGGELQFVNNDSNHYKFTGKERDGETGLDYFGARYYSNGLGRWVSADWSATPVPVPYADFSDPQTLNLYGYVRGLPTTLTDANGHLPILFSDTLQQIGQVVADFVHFALFEYHPHAGFLPQPCTCPSPQSQKQDGNKQNNNNSLRENNEQGRDAQGRFTSKQPGQTAPGAAAEKEALDAVGATKNTSPIPGSNRIPDGTIGDVTKGGQYVQYMEGKSGTYVTSTAQLRQMAKAAMKATGNPLKLVTTNPGVKFAKSILNNKNIEIVRLNQR